ncbi:MAG: hypothetical protein ACE5J2_05455 [Nitrososphaerales archaeon]
MSKNVTKLVDKITWEILIVLKQSRDGLLFSELSRVVSATDPTISNRLKLLKRYDLVRVILRIDDRTKRRYFVHVITPKGSKILEKYRAFVLALQNNFGIQVAPTEPITLQKKGR